MKRGLLVVCAVAVAVAALAPGASAVVVRVPGGPKVSIAPKAGVGASSLGARVAPQSPKRTSAAGNLDYFSGPVLHSSAAYLIFWTPPGDPIPSSSQALLQRYLADTAADSGKATNVYPVARQFTDGSGFTDYKQTLNPGVQARTDSAAFPSQDTANCPDLVDPHCLTDAQLQSELSAYISNNGLPTGTGPNAPIYFIVTPSDTNICLSATVCTNNKICAYHGPMASGPSTILYSSIPMYGTAHGPKGCQYDGNSAVQEPNGDPGDVAIKYLSHEQNETITDPLLNGWFDGSTGQENGDKCNTSFTPTLGGDASAGTLYNQAINGDHYYIQSEWSNGDINCEMQPTAGSISPSFIGPTVIRPNQPASFDPTPSTSSRGFSSATWDFGDGGSAFSAVDPGSNPSMTSHAFSTSGPYTVRLTLVDAVGNVSSVTDTAPDDVPSVILAIRPAAIRAGMSAVFDGSGSRELDGNIRSYQWDFGDGATASGQTPQHTYRREGTYTVLLTVTDTGGQTSQGMTTVDVGQPKISSEFKRGVLKVTVDQAGTVNVQSKRKTLRKAGTVKFKLKLSRRQKQQLRSRHHLKLKLKIAFSPANADRITKAITVKLKG